MTDGAGHQLCHSAREQGATGEAAGDEVAATQKHELRAAAGTGSRGTVAGADSIAEEGGVTSRSRGQASLSKLRAAAKVAEFGARAHKRIEARKSRERKFGVEEESR